MIRNDMLLALSFLLAACGSTEESGATGPEADNAGGETSQASEAAAEPPPEPTRVLADGSRLFGGEPSEREQIELNTILGAPADYDGQTVKTVGEISAVCQRMGCWMELRADAEGPGIRVPMANHSFFLPRDLAGARATIEGTVHVAALDESTREHLESEGAEAADSELSIEATSVLVHP